METLKLSKRCGFVVVKLSAAEAAQLEGRARRVVWLPREQWRAARLDALVYDAAKTAERCYEPQKVTWGDEGYLVDRIELLSEELERARRNSSNITWSHEDIFYRLRWLHDKISSFECYATNHLMPRTRNPKPSQYQIDYYWDRVRACREEQRELLSHLPPDIGATLREALLIP